MDVTPSTEKRELARGEGCGGERVERGLRYSMKEEGKSSGRTRLFGLNLTAWGILVLGMEMELGTDVWVWGGFCLDEEGAFGLFRYN